MWLDRLNAFKKKSGKTTEQISIESGIPKGTLNKLFSGQTKDPQYSTLKAVVHCLGHTVDDLDPAAKETASIPDETEVEAATEKLYMALLDSGFLKSGEDLTPKQVEFLLGISSLLRAFFQEEA